MSGLISRWTEDITSLTASAKPVAVASVGAQLLARWSEPHRRYHCTRHLTEMFWALAELTDADELTADEARLGRIAAWLHDAEYDPAAAAGVNEAESARLACVLLPQVGLASDAVDVVVGLVEMTVSHTVCDDDPLQRAFHDADLWILAAPAQRFDAYCAQVREEYAAVPHEAYRLGRTAILRGLAGPDGIYLTAHGTAHWEDPARENIARELARLSSLG